MSLVILQDVDPLISPTVGGDDDDDAEAEVVDWALEDEGNNGDQEDQDSLPRQIRNWSDAEWILVDDDDDTAAESSTVQSTVQGPGPSSSSSLWLRFLVVVVGGGGDVAAAAAAAREHEPLGLGLW